MGESIIEQVFVRRIVETIISLVLIIVISFVIRWAVKEEVWPKWRSYLIWGLASALVVVVLGIALLNIHLDITQKGYIIYQGPYIERGGGQGELKTVVVYDEEGNEIRIFRNGKAETGEFEGTVVYGRCSKIVVEYSGVPKD